MELSCSLLTGFFLWLFVYHWRRKSIARMRRLAGNHVFTAGSTVTRTLRWTFFVYLSLVLLVQLGDAILFPRLAQLTLSSDFGLAVLFAAVLMLGIPRTRNTAIEIRERGVLFGVGVNFRSREGLQFVPWNQIAACQWVPKRFGGIARFDGTHNFLTIGQDAVPPEQKTGVTAAMGRFVPVYDQDSAPLAKPDEEHRDAISVSWCDLDGPRFQFDLQTMLLLVVVVACAANLFALRYRSPHHQAVVRLEAFNPRIHYFKQEVRSLDFSACANKPTDDDLACLEPLSELEYLDLAGSPITDAGLVHLKRLKNLRHVTLANTFVTLQAMKDLQRDMPGLSVGAIRYPPVPNPIVVPSHKGQQHP